MRTRSTATVVLVAVAVAASFVVAGGPLGALDGDDHDADQREEPQEETYLRVVHASPDAPAVDVLVDGEAVLEDVPFGAVSDYLTLGAGTYNVSITVADDPEAVVFEDELTLEPRRAVTLAASGEVSEDADTAFEPVALQDDAVSPDEDSAAIRVAHLSPDAPAVDVTVTTDDGTLVLADNVSFREASDYLTVPAGDYTVDIRAATADDDGDVVTSVDVSLSGGEVYTAMAVGYLNPDDAPADTPFEVLLPEDAQVTFTLPGEEMTPTATATGTATATASPTATETPTRTETPSPTETVVITETPTATETPEPTDSPVPTETPERTETPEPTGTETPEPTGTETPGPTATETPEPTGTPSPTGTPANETETPDEA